MTTNKTLELIDKYALAMRTDLTHTLLGSEIIKKSYIDLLSDAELNEMETLVNINIIGIFGKTAAIDWLTNAFKCDRKIIVTLVNNIIINYPTEITSAKITKRRKKDLEIAFESNDIVTYLL